MTRVCIHFLSVRIKGYASPALLVEELLGLDSESFTHELGRYGYCGSLKCGNISVLYDGSDPMGMLIEMSGDGCEQYCLLKKDDAALIKLLLALRKEDSMVTRIDIAFDDLEGKLDMSLMKSKLDSMEIRTRMRSWTNIDQTRISTNEPLGLTMYVGQKDSNSQFRIYDKGLQQMVDDQWIRVELTLRKEESDRFVRSYLESVQAEMTEQAQFELFSKLAAQLALGKLAFLETRKTNNSRSPVCEWWSDFLSTSVAMKLAPVERIQSVQKTEKWARECVAKSLADLTVICGSMWLVELIIGGFLKRKTDDVGLVAFLTGLRNAIDDYLGSISTS